MSEKLFVPVSYCKICDAGRPVLEVPDEPCGHDRNETTFGIFDLEVVPAKTDVKLPIREVVG